jgi:pimeloyl-ACP methyl ester carboxylesterase
VSATAAAESSARIATGVQISYSARGDGPPLLLITGTSASYGMWGELVPALAGSHRVIAYDARGLGGSERGNAPISISQLADDALALMDALGIERADLLGWSLGSATAQELTLSSPERVGSLALYGTWGHADGFQRAMFTALSAPWRAGDLGGAFAALGLAFSPELQDSPEFEGLMEGMVPMLPSTPEQMAATVEQWDADLAHDTAGRLSRIGVPTLVIAGEQDLLTPPWQGRKVADAIPGAEFHLITGPGSSHAAHIERPDEFLTVLTEFLERSPLQ